MIARRTFGNSGVGLVMTDLFVSAAAALMMVLAITRPTPEIPLPIQADLIAACPPLGTDYTLDSQPVMTVSLPPSHGAVSMPVTTVSRYEEIWALPAKFGLPPRLFYTIALSDDVTPLTAACADWVLNALIRTANEAADDRSADAAVAIFGLDLVLRAKVSE